MAPSIAIASPPLTSFPSFSASLKLRGETPSSKNVIIDPQAERKALLAAIRGQTIRIPDLAPLTTHWPTKTNPDIDLMRADIREWLNATLPQGKVLTALQRSDFGLFGATWWPQSALPRLKIGTYLAVWLFTWDDEIDLSDGTMWTAFSAAQLYREQTLSYVRWSLGLEPAGTPAPKVTNRIILNFEPIGDACRSVYTREQNERVLEEMRFFMDMSEREQRLRLSGCIPSVDEFWHYRLGSSAVAVCLALNEFSWGISPSSPSSSASASDEEDGEMRLPPHFHADADVARILTHTNTIISATNDLLSLKKELARSAIDSLVPILYHHLGSVQRAVDEVVSFIGAEIGKMDDAAEAVLRRYEGAGEEGKVRDFVDGCKHYVTGNLTWSLETDRYGVERVGGEIVMTL